MWTAAQLRLPSSRACFVQRVFVGVAGVKRLEVVGGRVQRLGPRTGQRRQEERIRPRPRVAHGVLVEHLEVRRLALHEIHAGRTERSQRLVRGDVFPVVAEVLAGERPAVRPPVAGAEPQGEDAPVHDVQPGQEIGSEAVVGVVADQSRIAVDDHQAHVLAAAHQQPQLAPVAAGRKAVAVEPHHARLRRQAVLDGGKLASGDLLGEGGDFDVRRCGRPRARECDETCRGQPGSEHATERGDGQRHRPGWIPACAHRRSVAVDGFPLVWNYP